MASQGTYKGVNITSGTDAEVAKQIADIDASLKPTSPSPTGVKTPTPITPTDMTGTATPAKVSPPPTGTGTAGLEGTMDAFTADLDRQTTEAQKGAETSKASYLEGILGSKGETTMTGEAYAKKGGVNEIETELNDINQQIRQEQHGLRRQVEKIEKNTQGLFGGAVGQEVERVKRESLSKQADLAVIQMGIQGRYDSAKTIADRAVQMKLEQQKIKNEALQFNYQENKELFTKAEQRLFETKQADRERAYARQERDLQQISDLSLDALQNGAPTNIASMMRQAKTVEEAMKIGGQYVGALDRQLKQAQLSKIRSEMSASVATPLSLSQAQGNIKQIGDILNSGGMASAVGTNFLSRAPRGFWGSLGAVASVVGIPSFIGGVWKKASGQHQNFTAGVEQLQSQLSLDSLIQAKAKGATFGALSDSELRMLSASASKLGSWVKRDTAGNVVGYDTTEANMKKELDRINNFAKLDYLLKGGSPQDVDAQVLSDGTIWSLNSDGTYTQLN